MRFLTLVMSISFIQSLETALNKKKHLKRLIEFEED